MNFSLPPYWEHFNPPFDLIEKGVSLRVGSYQGLRSEALYTSREDYLALFGNPLIAGTFVDLGCGTGEGCLLYGSLFPERSSIGIEFEKARLSYGIEFKSQHDLHHVDLRSADLLVDEIPKGDTYFLYFPTGMVLDRVLTELYRKKHFFRVVAIESHGDLLARLTKENWLTPVREIPLSGARHYSHAQIFERIFEERSLELMPFELSYEDFYLVIAEGDNQWLGNSRGLEWTNGERFELAVPPRTIYWSHVKRWLRKEELTPELQLAVTMREMGEVEIEVSGHRTRGIIRKILLSPTFGLEISTGEQLEWNKILTIKKGTHLCYASS